MQTCNTCEYAKHQIEMAPLRLTNPSAKPSDLRRIERFTAQAQKHIEGCAIARQNAEESKLATFDGRSDDIITTIGSQMERDGMSPFNTADALVAFETYRYQMSRYGYTVNDDFETFSAFNDSLVTVYRFYAA